MENAQGLPVMENQCEVKKQTHSSPCWCHRPPKNPGADVCLALCEPPSLHNVLVATGNTFPGGYHETKLSTFRNECVASNLSCIKEPV